MNHVVHAFGCVMICFFFKLALERGEKLGELEERTEKMRLDAELYSQAAQQIKNKYKDKKWYQL